MTSSTSNESESIQENKSDESVVETDWSSNPLLADSRPKLLSEPAPFPSIQRHEWSKYSIRTGLIGRKVGMMSLYDDDGTKVPVTAIVIDRNHVVQVKEPMENTKDQKWGIQVGAGFKRPYQVQKPQRFHCAKAGVETKEKLVEFRVTPDAILPVGLELGVEHFIVGQEVDVKGTTKGKGFQGTMKRWGFSGGPASHGSKFHRRTGSVGGREGGVRKGKKMPGRMGCDKRTAMCLRVVKIDAEKNVMYVTGCIPGYAGNWVLVRDAYYHRDKWLWKSEKVPPFPTALQLSRKVGEVTAKVPPPPDYVDTLQIGSPEGRNMYAHSDSIRPPAMWGKDNQAEIKKLQAKILRVEPIVSKSSQSTEAETHE
eukprot:CAMPEP_0182444176 /NCGR_PEP_ID=MMETSP1172-20130603/2715_1 /TAXON_ID=708627 /ORGANISM="Timspurckia oligopyrenoides, Strain CCMP3278" /LENGTH=367 /DNA_ID=CAMNT_0024639685 /DNA_START=139 /DNA_END=1242 /DNA_ORIENTATION=-